MSEIREKSIVVRVIARFVFSWLTLYIGAKENVRDHQLFIIIDTPSITCLHRLRLYIIFLGGLKNDSCFFFQEKPAG